MIIDENNSYSKSRNELFLSKKTKIFNSRDKSNSYDNKKYQDHTSFSQKSNSENFNVYEISNLEIKNLSRQRSDRGISSGIDWENIISLYHDKTNSFKEIDLKDIQIMRENIIHKILSSYNL